MAEEPTITVNRNDLRVALLPEPITTPGYVHWLDARQRLRDALRESEKSYVEQQADIINATGA